MHAIIALRGRRRRPTGPLVTAHNPTRTVRPPAEAIETRSPTSPTVGTSSSNSSTTTSGRSVGMTTSLSSRRRSCRSKRCSITLRPCTAAITVSQVGAWPVSSAALPPTLLLDLSDEEIVSRFAKDLRAVFPELEGKPGNMGAAAPPGRALLGGGTRFRRCVMRAAASTSPATTCSICRRSPTRPSRRRKRASGKGGTGEPAFAGHDSGAGNKLGNETWRSRPNG